MKKYSLFLFVFIIAAISSVQAQDTKWGLKGGLNSASFSGDDSDGIGDAKSSFLIGAVYDYTFTHRIGVQVDVMYTNTILENKNSGDSSELNMTYMNVPIVFKYYFTQNINVFAGPEFGLLARASYNGGDDASEMFTVGKLRAVAGAQYKLDMGLIFDLRYALGLTSIGADMEDYQGTDLVTESFDIKYSALQISVGYLF